MSRYMLRIVQDVPVEVGEAELMTLTAAAKRLRLAASSVRGAINRGELRWIVDTSEPNPTRASRVFVSEVEAAWARRRGRGRSRPGRLPKKREKAPAVGLAR